MKNWSSSCQTCWQEQRESANWEYPPKQNLSKCQQFKKTEDTFKPAGDQPSETILCQEVTGEQQRCCGCIFVKWTCPLFVHSWAPSHKERVHVAVIFSKWSISTWKSKVLMLRHQHGHHLQHQQHWLMCSQIALTPNKQALFPFISSTTFQWELVRLHLVHSKYITVVTVA